MKTYKILLIVLLVGTYFTSCKKDPDSTTVTPIVLPVSMVMKFNNMVGDSVLVFNSKSYINAHADTFTVSAFKYYISNIKLTRVDGTVFSEVNSYHLIDASSLASSQFTVNGVPDGKYVNVSFLIGVDSLRNVSGAQTGALDPALGMFWTWSTGYIMAELSGTSPQVPNFHSYSFMINGFSGPYNSIRTVSTSLNGDTIKISKGVIPQLSLKADVQEWFKTPNIINLATVNSIGLPDSTSNCIANNYANMFTFQNIQ